MRRLIITLGLLIAPFFTRAQNLKQFADEPGVNEVVITQNMFTLLSKVDLEDENAKVKDFVNLVKSLKRITIYSTEAKATGRQMREAVQGLAAASKVNLLMQVKKEGNKVVFYSAPGREEGRVKQLLMFMQKQEGSKSAYVLLSIKGNIDLSQIGKLAGMFDFPGAKELEAVHQPKSE